jgi:hypothetical protein
MDPALIALALPFPFFWEGPGSGSLPLSTSAAFHFLGAAAFLALTLAVLAAASSSAFLAASAAAHSASHAASSASLLTSASLATFSRWMCRSISRSSMDSSFRSVDILGMGCHGGFDEEKFRDQTLPNAKFNTHVPYGLGPKGEILLHP